VFDFATVVLGVLGTRKVYLILLPGGRKIFCEASHSDKNEICKKEIWSKILLTRHQENCEKCESSHSIRTSLKWIAHSTVLGVPCTRYLLVPLEQ
jgi:hypothetical protein